MAETTNKPKAAKKEEDLAVVATRRGVFHSQQRHAGDSFTLDHEEQFQASWMAWKNRPSTPADKPRGKKGTWNYAMDLVRTSGVPQPPGDDS